MIDCDIVYIVKIFYKTSNVDFIIRNILHFNKNNKVILLLNIAEYLYDKLNVEELQKKYDNVIFYRCKAYRTKFDPRVIQCVTNCMNYIINDIKCDYIVLSHDSEVYVKKVDINIIKNNMKKYEKKKFDREEINKILNQSGEHSFWWKRFMELENMFNYFMENEMVPAIDVCPGLTITYDTLQKIIKDLNTLSSDYYLNSERRVLLDEVIYHSLIVYHSGEYCNTNHTYWITDKREALRTEEETLNLLIKDLEEDNLKNKFSIKKSYKNVCNYVDEKMQKEN
jgi:hypothetical protein